MLYHDFRCSGDTLWRSTNACRVGISDDGFRLRIIGKSGFSLAVLFFRTLDYSIQRSFLC
jgi:hypothetical protein